MWQREAVGLNYQITLLSNVSCGQSVSAFRPEADSNSVHEAPETPDRFWKGKEMNSQEEKCFSPSTCMFINFN